MACKKYSIAMILKSLKRTDIVHFGNIGLTPNIIKKITGLATMFTLICLLTSVNPCMYIKMTFFLQKPRHNDYIYMGSPWYDSLHVA